MKRILWLYAIFIVVVHSEIVKKNVLSRRKRYVAFPEGSSFVATVCATVESVADNSIYYQGLNWGVSWLLPNRSSVEEYVTDYKKRRRQRRDLYARVEDVVERMGFNGRSCIYKALCEAPRRFKYKPSSISEDLLRIIFKFPTQYLSVDEPDDHHLYHRAYRDGILRKEQQECDEMYPDCSISLIDLALGNYGRNADKNS